jgi:3-methyladenine DNA glycosylase AlkD
MTTKKPLRKGVSASRTARKGPTARKRTAGPKPTVQAATVKDQVQGVLAWLERQGTKQTRDGMARYGIPSDKAFGVSIGALRDHSKQLGKNHALALALWDTGRYEPRMLAAFVDDPVQVTAAQMDRWAKQFDNWAVCDHACFHLFDRTPHAWGRVAQWAGRREEFVKRAAFAMLWGLTVHDKSAADAPFLHGLALIERAATDERHLVKKAVNMSLRAIGKRNASLRVAAMATAKRLSESGDATARWVGTDALRELSRLRSRT